MKQKRHPDPKLADLKLADPKPDGRNARSERSREAVVQAVLGFVREGLPRPTATQIARRAKVSRRVVFNQFNDMERPARSAWRALRRRRMRSSGAPFRPPLRCPSGWTRSSVRGARGWNS